MRRTTLFATGCLAIAAVAALAGALFDVVRGGTTITRSIAYALWIAATLCLLLMVPAGSKRFWRGTSLPVVDGWMFMSAACVLTVLGAAVDAVGS